MRPGRRLIVAGAGLGVLGLAIATLVPGAEPSGDGDALRLFGLWRLRHVALFLALALLGGVLILRAISRGAMVYALIVLGTVAGFSAVLEAAGRAGLVDWADLLSPAAGDLDDLGTRHEPFRTATGETYQDTAFLLGLQSEAIPFDFRADRHGFRNTPDHETADIILLGDSMLVGALVDADKTVSGRLDALLPASVMQVALIGIGVQEQHRILRESGIDIAGRTVVQFVFEGNDLLDSRSYRSPPAPEANPPGRSLLRSMWNLATLATGRPDDPAAFDSCRIGDQLYTFLWTDRAFLDHEAELDQVTAALGTFATEVAQKGGRYLLVFVPTKFRVLSDRCIFAEGSRLQDIAAHLSPLRSHLRGWADAAGLGLLDLTDPLRIAARDDAIPWFWGDTHWNETGHEITARALAEWDRLTD